jgi:aryl-alcohol dehydrogenase-like predicted oxidoreductase
MPAPRGHCLSRLIRGPAIPINAKCVAEHDAKPAEAALAWLMVRKGVTAPIASATDRQQLASLIRAVDLKLSSEDIGLLDAASG